MSETNLSGRRQHKGQAARQKVGRNRRRQHKGQAAGNRREQDEAKKDNDRFRGIVRPPVRSLWLVRARRVSRLRNRAGLTPTLCVVRCCAGNGELPSPDKWEPIRSRAFCT
jgi:hypothetical protein